MKISKNTWHFRVFTWWYSMFHGGYTFDDFAKATKASGSGAPAYNLCPYVRAVVLWAPLFYTFTPPRLWYTLVALFGLFNAEIYHKFGLHGLKVELQVFAFIAGIASAVGVIFGIIYSLVYLIKTYNSARYARLEESGEESFFALVAAYFKNKHDKICPRITFTDQE